LRGALEKREATTGEELDKRGHVRARVDMRTRGLQKTCVRAAKAARSVHDHFSPNQGAHGPRGAVASRCRVTQQ
jgi:hypothetical protein